MFCTHHIELPKNLIEILWQKTKEAYPREACALLFGTFSENDSSDSEINGRQAEAGVALAVLGIAIAVWLIGWAITGECDWYMGAYSP